MQDPSSFVDLLSVTDVTIIGVLLTIIAFLLYERKQLKDDLKTKEDKIYEIIKEHQEDLKDNTKDFYQMSEKWVNLFNELKALMR